MKLKVLGSGSSGNCYLLENNTECLVIEAGLSFMEVKKALDFNVRKIVGILVSHIHGDHAKYIEEYRKAGIPIMDAYRICENNGGQSITCVMGNFTVREFQLIHDAPCYGFYITHPEMGSLIYASDTEYIKYRFKGINHILCEANYDMQFVNWELPNYKHILQGHMSLQTALDFISTNDNPALRNVVLIHLSDKNAESGEFLKRTKEVTGKAVYIASKGLVVDLNLCPF